jgi:hypothetical protein
MKHWTRNCHRKNVDVDIVPSTETSLPTREKLQKELNRWLRIFWSRHCSLGSLDVLVTEEIASAVLLR